MCLAFIARTPRPITPQEVAIFYVYEARARTPFGRRRRRRCPVPSVLTTSLVSHSGPHPFTVCSGSFVASNLPGVVGDGGRLRRGSRIRGGWRFSHSDPCGGGSACILHCRIASRARPHPPRGSDPRWLRPMRRRPLPRCIRPLRRRPHCDYQRKTLVLTCTGIPQYLRKTAIVNAIAKRLHGQFKSHAQILEQESRVLPDSGGGGGCAQKSLFWLGVRVRLRDHGPGSRLGGVQAMQ